MEQVFVSEIKEGHLPVRSLRTFVSVYTEVKHVVNIFLAVFLFLVAEQLSIATH